MPEESTELRKINWTQTFPFLRLFRTFGRTMNYTRLGLALACVIAVCVGGWILDFVWVHAGDGVAVQVAAGAPRMTELDKFATSAPPEFRAWRLDARAAADAAREEVKRQKNDIKDRAAKIRNALKSVDSRLADRLLDAESLSGDRRSTALNYARYEADKTIFALYGKDASALGPEDADGKAALAEARAAAAKARKEHADKMPEGTDAEKTAKKAAQKAVDDQPGAEQKREGEIAEALTYAAADARLAALTPRGPFKELLFYETRCVALAVRSVCAGRLGFSSADDPAGPALVTSLANGGMGGVWLVTQHRLYAVLLLVLLLAASGLFGGAICRHAAVDIARDESLGASRALSFAVGKWKEFILAPLLPIALIVLGGVLMWLGGLLGSWWILRIVAGLAFFLELVGGFVLALALIGLVLGGHLMWPTIAVESSDAFDAVTRAFGYVGQRIWHSLFYCVSLLAYGGLAFALVRLVAMVSLKFAHGFAGSGMSFFGKLTSSETNTVGRLDAMWHMPAWSEISLLPTSGGTPFWGEFGSAPLSGVESVATCLIACWVYLFVCLVGAFVVGFYFCGSTEAYFLLRRDLDATEYDEVFYEEELELEPAAAAAPTTGPTPPAPPAPPTPEPPPAPVAPE